VLARTPSPYKERADAGPRAWITCPRRDLNAHCQRPQRCASAIGLRGPRAPAPSRTGIGRLRDACSALELQGRDRVPPEADHHLRGRPVVTTYSGALRCGRPRPPRAGRRNRYAGFSPATVDGARLRSAARPISCWPGTRPAEVPGLEPESPAPEAGGLPITPYPTVPPPGGQGGSWTLTS
jgi:hypothetical protein